MARTIQNRPPVWSLIKEAVEAMNGEASYKDIKNYIWQRYEDVNERTINCQIIICSVNQKSRVYYPANRKPRECRSRYDFLYTLGNGRVTMYDPDKHGLWAIIEKDGRLTVSRIDHQHALFPSGNRPHSEAESAIGKFDLTQVVIDSLRSLGRPLTPYYLGPAGDQGQVYSPDIGVIDILATENDGKFVVVKLENRVTPDTLAILLGQMGWVRKNLAPDTEVKGMLLAGEIDDHMKLSIAAIPNLELYQLRYSLELNRIS